MSYRKMISISFIMIVSVFFASACATIPDMFGDGINDYSDDTLLTESSKLLHLDKADLVIIKKIQQLMLIKVIIQTKDNEIFDCYVGRGRGTDGGAALILKPTAFSCNKHKD